jgi:hypothetical protein
MMKPTKDDPWACDTAPGRNIPSNIVFDPKIVGEMGPILCDHLIGVAGWVDQHCFDGDKVFISHLVKRSSPNSPLIPVEDIRECFYYCPKQDCGEKIDWVDIVTYYK